MRTDRQDLRLALLEGISEGIRQGFFRLMIAQLILGVIVLGIVGIVALI